MLGFKFTRHPGRAAGRCHESSRPRRRRLTSNLIESHCRSGGKFKFRVRACPGSVTVARRRNGNLEQLSHDGRSFKHRHGDGFKLVRPGQPERSASGASTVCMLNAEAAIIIDHKSVFAPRQVRHLPQPSATRHASRMRLRKSVNRSETCRRFRSHEGSRGCRNPVGSPSRWLQGFPSGLLGACGRRDRDRSEFLARANLPSGGDRRCFIQ